MSPRSLFTLPAEDEERSYTIGTWGQAIHVRIRGVPPCLWCGEPVTRPSADGPLVCGWCDRGKNKDGSSWTAEQHRKRAAHRSEQLEKYRNSEK